MGAPTKYHIRDAYLTISLLLVVAIAPTHAQEPSALGDDSAREAPVRSASEERALALFLEAEGEFASGRVEHALNLLVAARAEHPVPVLLFNIARAYETLGREAEALDSYRAYLEEDPATSDRGAIETRIAAIESDLSIRAQLEEDRRNAEARADAASGRRAVPWIIATTGLATLGAGAVFGAIARRGQNESAAESEHMEAVELFDRAERHATTANVLFIVGGVLSAAGVVWVVADGVRRARAGNLELSASLDRVGLRVWLR